MFRECYKNQQQPFGSGKFDVVVAICTILEAATTFQLQGYKQIWIYFVFGRLHFTRRYLDMPAGMIIGAYLTASVLAGLDDTKRHELYYRLAVAYILMSN